MNKTIRYLWLLPVLFVALPSALHAQGEAVSTMAGIVMHLNHYPSGSDKKTLAAIAQDAHTTAGEKVLATALMNMRHQVGGADAKKLRALVADEHADKGERELADILLGLNHKPSASDKKRLRSLIE